MGRFNIVIEGVDGTGKSTLAKRLLLELPSARLRTSSEDKPQSRQELKMGLARVRGHACGAKINIFDRHPAITEACYQDQGGLALGKIKRELLDCKIDMIIWATKPLEKLEINVRKNDSQDVAYNRSLKPRLPAIIARYNALMPVLQDFMLFSAEETESPVQGYFEVYTDWDCEHLYTLFVNKIALLATRD